MAQPQDYGYGEDEDMLRGEVRKFLRNKCDERTVMKLVAHNPDLGREPECLWDRELWGEMVNLGLTTMAIPEAQGGLGMSAVAVATVIEEAGRAALPSPLIACVNAAYVLRACNGETANAALTDMAAGKTASLAVTNKKGSWSSADTDVSATESAGATKLNGTAWFVQDARKVDFYIVKAASSAGIALYRVPVDAPGLTITPDSIVDLTRDQAHITFSDVGVDAENILADAGQGETVMAAAEPAILTMIAADMCGAAEWQMQTTAEHARTREQFDRPIGFFQAVKHPIVDMMINIDAARSLVYNAACAIDHEPEEAAEAAHMAKAEASDMAQFCSRQSVQLHGGMGFTWECPVQLYFKRQMHNQMLHGDGSYHRAKLANILIGPISPKAA